MEEEPIDDHDVRELLAGPGAVTGRKKLTSMVLRRARSQTGQRDVLLFVLVKIWAALAKVVAPFFAFLGEKQAEADRHISTKGVS